MTKPSGGCGGGGKGGLPYSAEYWAGSGGGGATILYYETQKLASRIMVSGGGGGGLYSGCASHPGYAGGLIAGNGGSFQSNLVSKGGSQNFGTENGVGQDGRNSIGKSCGAEGNPGCGGGYRGGTTTTVTGEDSDVSGSGGSSYVSGHPGCLLNSLASFFDANCGRKYVSGDPGCQTNLLASFYDTKILSGNKYFDLPNGTNSLGNPSHGHLQITKSKAFMS
ncbi:loricrin, putative [Trichomonas vaginalis G3]|uniref:receptor protein-tyrosine kinase n=1 Tax=Trichomonas vaginalis (strain ATCC PRA-98 / G3) TaxID=412133 RepID=A2F6K9_TRIV3|nr:glycine-rich protein family [Trichomonas vaginalis G3]EAX99454.1 loricrin, putative [Trichomonas vaginalis G3]KAI5541620.1 glycine-rich protein family [Trichomonas vaginalis G3]|eukprot:XP_001312384.1 loricrin [Trichomonas vaginalis G3]